MTSWDTPHLPTEAGKVTNHHGSSRFQSERLCPEQGRWFSFHSSSLPPTPLPTANMCMEISLLAKPYRLTFQMEAQGLGATAVSIAWKSGGTALLTF